MLTFCIKILFYKNTVACVSGELVNRYTNGQWIFFASKILLMRLHLKNVAVYSCSEIAKRSFLLLVQFIHLDLQFWRKWQGEYQAVHYAVLCHFLHCVSLNLFVRSRITVDLGSGHTFHLSSCHKCPPKQSLRH